MRCKIKFFHVLCFLLPSFLPPMHPSIYNDIYTYCWLYSIFIGDFPQSYSTSYNIQTILVNCIISLSKFLCSYPVYAIISTNLLFNCRNCVLHLYAINQYCLDMYMVSMCLQHACPIDARKNVFFQGTHNINIDNNNKLNWLINATLNATLYIKQNQNALLGMVTRTKLH